MCFLLCRIIDQWPALSTQKNIDGQKAMSILADTEVLMHTQDNNQGPVFLTINQLCRRWGISRSTFYKMEEAGNIPKCKMFGKHRRFHINDVLAWEEQQ